MSLRMRVSSLQFEIIMSLFVIVLAGLAIVAVVMGALAAATVDRAALDQLRIGAKQLERMIARDAPRLRDLSALVRTSPTLTLGGNWMVLDARGRDLASLPGAPALRPELLELARVAGETGESLAGGGLPLRDRMLALHIVTASGEHGTLIGRVSQEELMQRLRPILRSGALVLLISTSVFVVFGSYLLHRRIVRPVQQLSMATRQVTAGDLSVSIEAAGSDELGELARNFNVMAESLAHEQEALKRAHRSLTQSARLAGVGRLAAGVAHEVGNPVAAILGYVELLFRDPALSARARDASEHVRDEALRVRALVRELLDLSRYDAIDLGPLEPSALLERVAERMCHQKLLEGVELVTELEPDLPLLDTDARRLEQILVNLIDNAAFSAHGESHPRIELRAYRTPGSPRPARRRDDPAATPLPRAEAPDAVTLAVIDNGPGIDPEDLPQLFDPFFTTKDPGEGTGLGLWNCHRIAELLGARLEAESQPGRTCFSLALPIADTTAAYVRPPRSDH